jgi:hypothetical protein
LTFVTPGCCSATDRHDPAATVSQDRLNDDVGVVPGNVRNKPLVLVQEGITDPAVMD